MELRQSRRRFLGVLGAAVAGGAAVGTGAATAEWQGSWPMLDYDVGFTKYNPGASSPTERLDATWSGRVNGLNGAVVGDGTVYVATTSSLLAYADGSVVWERSTGDTEWGNPVVDGDRLYVDSAQGVRALRASDGGPLWSFETAEKYTIYPMPVGDTVLVLGTNFLPGGEKEEPSGRVYALRRSDGTVRWERSVSKLWWSAVADGRLYAGSRASRVVCLDVADGSELWRHELESGFGSVTARGGRAYVGTGDGVVALTASGEKTWTGPPLEGVIAAPGRVFGVENETDLVALNAETGDEAWRKQASDGEALELMAGSSDALYGHAGKYVTAHSPTDGALLDTYEADASVWSAFVAGDSVFATTTNGDVYRITEDAPRTTTTTTRTTTRTTTTTTRTTPPASGDEVVVEVGPDRNLVFRPGTENPLRIPVGATVRWVWKSNSHNIVVKEQPEAADWTGTPGGKDEVYGKGYVDEHTFTVPGEYVYTCWPHHFAGARARIVVGESASAETTNEHATGAHSTSHDTTGHATATTPADSGGGNGGAASTSVPGFGVGNALAGLAGASYLFARGEDDA